jgi:ribosomal protein S18 acetylase RimI-like enzyme
MKIRRAEEKDLESVDHLLSEVLEVHASIRPDLFVRGTRKYTDAELLDIFRDEERPVFVAEDEDGHVFGYAFCLMERAGKSNNMVPHDSLYIDDLCVDAKARGKHVGHQLFEYVKQYAKEQGCYEVTLNVWEGNDKAKGFYEHEGLKTRKTNMEYILDQK